MIPVITIETPFRDIEMIEIFKPLERGVGGTMAFPIRINGFKDILEMNDDCLWEPTYKIGLLSVPITCFISELIETTLIPLITIERKNKNISCDCSCRDSENKNIHFMRFYYKETDSPECYKILCKMNKNALCFGNDRTGRC